MKIARALLCLFLLVTLSQPSALAQDEGGSSTAVVSSMKTISDIAAGNLMKTAEMLDDDMYAYRPAESVRTTGQILAHVANAQFMICSTAAGEDNPNGVNFEETATAKADIVAALQSSFDYCGGVYAGMTDEAGAEMRQLFGMSMAASAVLAFNSVHNYEHYGNLVTYMRMNDVVPPSSQ